MGLIINTPYAHGSITNISDDKTRIEVTNSTPSTDWVGRCIRFTSGNSNVKGNIFKIISIIGPSLQLEYALDISPFRDKGQIAELPSVGETFEIGWEGVELVDGTNIIANGATALEFGAGTITFNCFVNFENLSLNINSKLIRTTSANGCIKYGHITSDGTTYNGCQITDALNSSDGYGASSGTHMSIAWYDTVITYSGAITTAFMRIYLGTIRIMIRDTRIQGDIGGRLKAENGDCIVAFGNINCQSGYGLFNAKGDGTGIVEDCYVIDSKQATYHYWSISRTQVIRNLSFKRIEKLYNLASYAANQILTFSGIDIPAVKALDLLGTNAGTSSASNFIKLTNSVNFILQDAVGVLITDDAKFVARNNEDVSLLQTSSDGVADIADVLVMQWDCSVKGNNTFDNVGGLHDFAPFVIAFASYNYVSVALYNELDTNQDVLFVGLIDEDVTQQDKSIVDTYTEISNLDELYDYSKLYFYNNFETLPNLGDKLINNVNGELDFGDYNLNINDTGEVFEIIGNTVNVLSSALTVGDQFQAIRTTGIITGRDKLDLNGVVDSRGNQVTITVLDVATNTNVQIYNITDDIELLNVISVNGSELVKIIHDEDKSIRVQLTNDLYDPIEIFETLTEDDLIISVCQQEIREVEYVEVPVEVEIPIYTTSLSARVGTRKIDCKVAQATVIGVIVK